MKLSFAITVHSEYDYIRALISVLAEYIHLNSDGHQYEIVVVDDNSDERTKAFLFQAYQSFPRFISVYNHTLNGDFAAHKNFMNSKCTGDYIFHLDADEIVTPSLLAWIPELIESNPDVDAYWVPRINTVDGLTERHTKKWGWSVTGSGTFVNQRTLSDEEFEFLQKHDLMTFGQDRYMLPIVAWPDSQMRLYANKPTIKWKNKVHEQLTGFEKFGRFPETYDFAIIHRKTIARQEAQNAYYDTLMGSPNDY